MIVVLKHDPNPAQLESLKAWLKEKGITIHESIGHSNTILGLVGGALSQIGDLVASLVKRHCGVKDFGTIFPGHGGMMDRMDGILFCGVACYIFFRIAGL